MAGTSCERETETVLAAWASAGPGDLGDETAAHVGACARCAEIVELARLFRDERNAACSEACPPASGLVWWRAQLRARNEAAARASRPIAVIHAIALGTTAAAVAALAGIAATGLGGFLPAVGSRLSAVWTALQGVAIRDTVSLLPTGVLLIAAASLLLAPVALYLAVSED